MRSLGAALAASVVLSCGGGAADVAIGATTCSPCRMGVCVAGKCVATASLSPSWAFEISPPAGGASPPAGGAAGLTEVLNGAANLSTATGMLILKADAAVPITATFTYATSALVPGTARVALSIRSAIPGRPDLTFEAPASPGSTPLALKSDPLLPLLIPTGTFGRDATLSLVPSPDDQPSPPLSFSVSVAATIDSTIASDAVMFVRGQLVTAGNAAPTSPFIARIFEQGTGVAVSNRAVVQPDGTFVLEIARAISANDLVVELTPSTPGGPDPWFRSDPMPLSTDLGTFKLAPYLPLNQFHFGVTPAVAGALVRASTVIRYDTPGTTGFASEAVTGNDGQGTLSLLPGTTTTYKYYDLVVVPPASSQYATTCFPMQPTVDSSMTVFSLSLTAFRAKYHGRVLDDAGDPVPRVVVSASPVPGSGTIGACTAARASPASAVTDASGMFSLPLDPGQYQIDYDPPAGSPVPRLTRPDAVSIASDDLLEDVTLPKAGLLNGIVRGPDDGGLAGATIRIFGPSCDARGAACLLALAQTDADGHFQAIVPNSN